MDFHKLNKSGNGWVITHKRAFPANAPSFKKETIRKVFDFAYAMTFGKQGEHRKTPRMFGVRFSAGTIGDEVAAHHVFHLIQLNQKGELLF